MVHGLTPSTDCGLSALRTKLAESGFAKIGLGELGSELCIELEIKKIRTCEPEARFVLLGYDVGGASAVLLARNLTSKRVPVDAVVLLDPLACGRGAGVRTLLVTSGQTTSTTPYTDRLVVSDASHLNLPAHPATVAVITELLKDIATQHYQAPGDPVPAWSYPLAPEMQPVEGPKWDEWDILADLPGSPQPIGTRVTTQQIGAPVPVSTSAGPVVIKP
jgi:hypothetical protein